jgi:hypothetical protein
MALTAREAGERVGKTRQAIIKAIRKGTLSAEKDVAGEWRIEPAELFRVYPAVPAVENEPITRLSSDTAGLRRALEIRDEKITSLEQRLAAVEADKGGGPNPSDEFGDSWGITAFVARQAETRAIADRALECGQSGGYAS